MCAGKSARATARLDLVGPGSGQRGAEQRNYSGGQRGETGVFGETLVIAVKDLLNDYGKLEAGEREVEGDLGNVRSGGFCVVLCNSRSRQASGIGGHAREIFFQFVGIGGINPIGQGGA